MWRQSRNVAASLVIAGAGETAYRRHADAHLTTPRLLAEAARLALGDARMEPADIDGLGVASFSLAPDRAIDLAFRLELQVSWLMDDGTGGASAVEHAAARETGGRGG